MSTLAYLVAGVLSVALHAGAPQQQEKRDGYRDTPLISGQKWKVHDADRPYPREVTPGAVAGAPPSDAVVLFDGKDLSHWLQNDPGDDLSKAQPAKWKVVDGCMEVVPRTGSIYSKEKFGDCQIHLEWQEAANITGRGQNRGNSGIYIMSLFEVQILDSYKSPTYADGQAGALYGQWPPLVNPIKKPGEWQTYDIIFEAPKFKDGKLESPAYVTVMFNGVIVHHRKKLNGPSAHRTTLEYSPIPPEGRIMLQDHGPRESLRFRNIWVRKLTGYDEP
jgi:hypothetical protein